MKRTLKNEANCVEKKLDIPQNLCYTEFYGHFRRQFVCAILS